MRIFVTSFLAFLISGFAGDMVAQQLAVMTGATEEYILVFIASALVTSAVTILVFAAQFFAEPRAAVALVAKLSLALLVLGVGGLSAWVYLDAGGVDNMQQDLPILVGLVLPGAVTIIVHWLFVRWRLGPPAVPAGKGEPA